jgi:uncharacterized linocin/CFP29 family protein
MIQKTLPTAKTPGAANVPDDQFNAGPPAQFNEGPTRPFIEMSFEFLLTQAQVDNEATLLGGKRLARRAARIIAQAEDLLLLQGAGAALPPNVVVINAASAGNGLLGLAGNNVQVAPRGGGGYGENTFDAVIDGLERLNGAGHPGPYALLLSPYTYADAHRLLQNRESVADRIAPLVAGGFYQCGGLPRDRGLLMSLGGEPTTLYLAQDASAAFNQRNNQGNYLFRVFERIQYVAREADALVRLEFQP